MTALSTRCNLSPVIVMKASFYFVNSLLSFDGHDYINLLSKKLRICTKTINMSFSPTLGYLGRPTICFTRELLCHADSPRLSSDTLSKAYHWFGPSYSKTIDSEILPTGPFFTKQVKRSKIWP